MPSRPRCVRCSRGPLRALSHVDELGGWVWTRFHDYQWDLDYRNPEVLLAMFDVMGDLANRGADVLRLDAAPFIWKELGTDGENRPNAHRILQVFRAAMEVAAPGVVFKAEAIVSPDELVQYLGSRTATRCPNAISPTTTS